MALLAKAFCCCSRFHVVSVFSVSSSGNCFSMMSHTRSVRTILHVGRSATGILYFFWRRSVMVCRCGYLGTGICAVRY